MREIVQINPFLSSMMPGIYARKFALPRAQEEGMNDFMVVYFPHPFLINHKPGQNLLFNFSKLENSSKKADQRSC